LHIFLIKVVIYILDEEFFTFREYMRNIDGSLSASMEDYIEMIYRLSNKSGYTRVNELACALNVQPPSVSKMLQKLSDLEIVDYRKYDIIKLNKKGNKIGKSLLNRHNIIEHFLKIIGVTKGLLEETEKIEHTISIDTLKKIAKLLEFLENNEQVLEEFRNYQK